MRNKTRHTIQSSIGRMQGGESSEGQVVKEGFLEEAVLSQTMKKG